MSDLRQLKLSIDLIGKSAERTGSDLSRFKSVFAKQIAEVQKAIGGSTQGKDKQVIDSFNDAKRKVDAAVAALQQASKVAQGYGSSL